MKLFGKIAPVLRSLKKYALLVLKFIAALAVEWWLTTYGFPWLDQKLIHLAVYLLALFSSSKQ